MFLGRSRREKTPHKKITTNPAKKQQLKAKGGRDGGAEEKK